MDLASRSLGLFSKPPLEGRPNIKPGDHDLLNAHNRWFVLSHHVWGPTWKEISLKIAFGWGPGHIWLHTTLEDPRTHYMILEVCWENLWTLSFEPSQFHGHGSWLVCEVALNVVGRFSPWMTEENRQVSYRWTGWVWKITGWSSRLPEHYRSF